MTDDKSKLALEKIGSSILSHGYHVTGVAGGPCPKFAYTIGLHSSLDFELVFAGGAFFSIEEIVDIVKRISRSLLSDPSNVKRSLGLEGIGTFTLREAEISWGKKLLLGVLDYFNLDEIRTFQIIPDPGHRTIDVPNMEIAWNSDAHPIWQWLDPGWKFPVPPTSKAITNLDALRGHPVTEVVRWEVGQWEMFAGAGPDVEQDDIRLVPLGTLMGQDKSLEAAITLKIGSGLWRQDLEDNWHPWGEK